VEQHRVDGNEIFVIPVRVSSNLDVRDEILQRISEIRMQITENVDEWLVIHRGAIPGSDHYSEQLGHQHRISAYGGWHQKLVEPHRGQGGIYHRNDEPPEMVWHTTDHGLNILQIRSDHGGQTIQIGFPADWVRKHARSLDAVKWRTFRNDVVDGEFMPTKHSQPWTQFTNGWIWCRVPHGTLVGP
jgi:hypothetical protein